MASLRDTILGRGAFALPPGERGGDCWQGAIAVAWSGTRGAAQGGPQLTQKVARCVRVPLLWTRGREGTPPLLDWQERVGKARGGGAPERCLDARGRLGAAPSTLRPGSHSSPLSQASSPEPHQTSSRHPATQPASLQQHWRSREQRRPAKPRNTLQLHTPASSWDPQIWPCRPRIHPPPF